MNKIYWLICISLFFVLQVYADNPPSTEVRAVWLTTNYGLDWPKNRTDVDVQKRELIKILDELKEFNFNTVLLPMLPLTFFFKLILSTLLTVNVIIIPIIHFTIYPLPNP